jgi:hypothetical protein
MSVKVDVGSLSTVILAIKNLRVTAAAAQREAVLAAGPKALDRVKENVSARKYSLADLAGLDHPYARRHVAIQTSTLGGRYRTKPYLIHTRSGDLRRGIRGSTVGGAYQIEATGPHARFVIGATTRSNMLRRDVLVDTFNEDGTRRVILREIARVLGQRLRSQATIRGTPRAKHPSATEV